MVPLIFQMTLPAEIGSLRLLIQGISECAREQGFCQERVGKIELAVEEAFVNICSYAYQEQEGNGDVQVACKQDAERFFVEITDSGIPFDILTAEKPDTTSAISERKIGGLGIFFITEFMDDVKYRREKEKNILTLGILKKKC